MYFSQREGWVPYYIFGWPDSRMNLFYFREV